MATISLRVDDRESKLIRDYAKLKNTSVSDLMRNAIIEKIEDELDVENFDRVLATMEKTHSLDDVKKELGL
ncbi:type II toxin-antitoxin system RelB family antitoxin [Planomicrobium okeanokoites]|uniref:type II toxin-antitoxin system RelB family antitoxin n=1 Tax=Planomicrobium okeanokoites TaxID=244 RepID=UPI003565CECF